MSVVKLCDLGGDCLTQCWNGLIFQWWSLMECMCVSDELSPCVYCSNV